MMIEIAKKMEADTTVGETVEGNVVTFQEITDAVAELREWATLKTTTGSISTRLLYELAGHWCRMPQLLGGHLLLVEVHAVLDQIGAMEQAPKSRAFPTKPEAEFVGALSGLWHKHWFQASFLVRNLADEFSRNGTRAMFKRLNEQFGKNGWDGKQIDEEVVGLLTNAAVTDQLSNRAGRAAPGKDSRMTGEWIVFAKFRGRRVYLTLAAHNESDEAILDRCLQSVREFPELEEIEPFKSLLKA